MRNLILSALIILCAGGMGYAAADLAVSIEAAHVFYLPDTQMTYTVEVTNLGDATATNATVTTAFGSGFSQLTWTAAYSPGSSGPVVGAGNINNTDLTLAAGGKVTFTVVATIDKSATGTLTSTVTVMFAGETYTASTSTHDGGDNDGDGLTNYQEIITYGTNPNQKDSNGDGVEDGDAVSMGYSPTLNFSALIAHPPTGLYTASQMQAMAIGDLVLTREVNGNFVLNYDIQQSEDLQNWTTYQEYALPLTNLPTNKAFVRIKAIQGTQEALLDAKINGTISYINWYKSASISYYGRYNRFLEDGETLPVQPYTRTYGDGAIVDAAANTTFGDILISVGLLDRVMLPIGEYGYSNPVGYTAGAISLAQNGVAKAKPVNTAGVNYPLILCRNYFDSSAETRLFTASANSSRVVFILIPGLSTTEVAALKTKIDGPFNNTILGASDLVAKAVAGTATGTPAEYVNRGNCLITTSPLAGGGYDAWVYVAHD